MPKLLQINVTANWGSHGRIAEQIGLCAMSHGWESYIAYGRMMNPSKSKLIKVGTMADVYEHYAENILLDNEGLASRHATRAFLRHVDEIRPDLVHLHNIHDHWINYRLLFRYLAERKLPVVWTQHDQWATTGHCMYNPSGCDCWKEECHDCPASKWYSMDRSRRNYRLKRDLISTIPSLTIVPVSEWLSENIHKSFLKNRPIHIIHNGIDIDTFSPKDGNILNGYGINDKKKIVLGVASVWEPRKGLDDFYELAKLLPSDDYSIIIVGRQTENIKTITDGCQMVFVGRTQNTVELAQIYSNASVFVNPTYNDNFPTTNLEALACGTPVVTYDTGGSPEAIDSETGAVVEQGNVRQLKDAVIQICQADGDSYRQKCRARAVSLFDKRDRYQDYLRLYDNILSGK